MALPNPMESEDPAMDPMVVEGMESPEGESSDYVIEIKISGQGIQVGVESAGMAAEEGGEGAGDEEQYQSVQSIGEACRLIREIYASQGQIQSPAQGADDMEAGYK